MIRQRLDRTVSNTTFEMILIVAWVLKYKRLVAEYIFCEVQQRRSLPSVLVLGDDPFYTVCQVSFKEIRASRADSSVGHGVRLSKQNSKGTM